MAKVHTDYCEAETGLIKRLWIEGKSANEISAAIWERFRRRRTRNAVIGKVHRLGLDPRMPGSIRSVSVKRSPRARKTPVAGQRAPVAAKPKVRAMDAADTGITAALKGTGLRAVINDRTGERAECLPPLGLDIMQVTDCTCRYPVSGPPHRFCGHAVVKGRSWCAAHALIVFAQPAEAER